MRYSLLLLAAALSLGAADLTDLKHWVRVPLRPSTELSKETQWQYDPQTKTLLCTCDKGHEMLRSPREYSNFTLHVEWRFKKVEGEPRYNGGVLVRASADGEYFVQAQVPAGPATWLFADYPVNGKKERINLRDKMTAARVRPPGEWNTYDLTVKGPTVTLAVNGAEIGAFEPVPVERGYIGLEAEGFALEFRNVQVTEIGAAARQ